MRRLFCSLLIAPLFSCWSHAEELVPGVITFDPPGFLSVVPSGGYGTNSDRGVQIIRRYAATDNDPRSSQRLLIVSLREMGGSLDSASTVTSLQSNDPVLPVEMQAAMNSTPQVSHVSPVTNAMIASHPAWRATCEIPRPYWQKPAAEFFPCEVYWVKVQSNRVAEIKLIADSPEHLQTLRNCLSRFKITQAKPVAVMETTGNPP